ncbi:receptor-like protein EIX2 [Salvia miltiorrhiza]|uniref:receptor-like protein EIX2 n=1 Tax=Salvia miltiorrhiza TaxID=226208 RepID=UPI0025ACC12E|nr:receptor-like protein EIX2 [Salvia miltiorrhiza]
MKIVVSLLFFNMTALLSLFNHAFADALCRESDRSALSTFKNDLEDSSGRLSSWRGANCCNWEGVICDNATGRVRQLRLRNPHDNPCAHRSYSAAEFEAYHNHKLGGKLNPSLLNLEFLNHLDLSCNDFQGARVPDFISFMRNLQYIDLSSCGFHGVIPQQIANLSGLRYLNLGDPYPIFLESTLRVSNLQWLWHLSSLEHLDLTGVDVSKAIDWLRAVENLPSLLELRLSNCGLQAMISSNVANLTHLRVLDLSWNNFNSSLPRWIYSLANLEHLDLSHCGFYHQLPTGLQNMTKLEYLNLSSNDFSSDFPTWISRLSHLKVLAIADNLIEGELSDTIMDNLTSLVNLDLSQNRIEGMLPKSLSNLCNLEEMYLYTNRFSGYLPDFSGCISQNLRFLYLGFNNLSGPLPSNLKQLVKLRELDLTGNKLTGPLPLSLQELQELEYLVISDNFFQGIVSESHFRNLSRLKIFRANGNSFSFEPSRDWIPPLQLEGLTLRSWRLGPEFPPWIKHLKHLQYLSLASTGIEDAIPSWFWTLTSQMKYLNLSNNMIRGQIPSLLDFGVSRNVAIDMKKNLITGPLPRVSSNVTILDLSFNRISGSMNSFLCEHKMRHSMRLEILDLAYNFLSGGIPDCWGNWSYLSVLRLQANNLTGEIPSSMGLLTRLQSLHLRRNKDISGELPPSLQNCTGLMVLDLGRNHLSGRIPIWIDRLSELVVFNLRLNEFWGEIPVEICRLSRVQALDLAGNNLSGRIPSCLDGFETMAGRQRPSDRMYYSAEDTFGGVPDSQFLVVKGRFGLYSNILHWVMTLDLSDNSLTGPIPAAVTSLSELQTLNLSRNCLSGRIPQDIGSMRLLESLDLSKNWLSGKIPESISELSFLSNLNLSCNSLSGRIPSGTQLRGFDASSFSGNELCGAPLSERCEGSEGGEDEEEEEEEREASIFEGEGFGLVVSIAVGAVVGFWTVIVSLLVNVSWRNAYFGLMTRIGNYVYYVWVKCLLR